MKTLTIYGVEYEYRIRHYNLDGGVNSFTDFYIDTQKHTRKKYWLFGKMITVEKPNVIFTINCDIESPYSTKEYTRSLIDKELKPLKRLEEIKRGELI